MCAAHDGRMTVIDEREHDVRGLPLVVLVLREEDACRGGWLATQLDDVLRVRPDRVVVDLSACGALDSAALHALLDAHRRLARRGGVLALRGLCPRLVRLLSLSGLTDVLRVEETCEP